MSKWNDTEEYDVGLTFLMDNVTKICFCTQEPSSYDEAVNTYAVAAKAVTSADFTGPATGNSGGQSRKITVNAQSGIIPAASGYANHMVLVDETNAKMRRITECDYMCTVGQAFDSAPWDIEYGYAI
jgi:hypothetical protein